MAETHARLVRAKIGASRTRKLELSMKGVIADALQLAAVKCAGGLRGTALQGLVESCEIVGLDAMLEGLPKNPLIAVMEKHRDDGVGLCAMDADLVNNLVEILTGSVGVSGADKVERPFTGIDAVLCRQFVNLLVEKFREVLGEVLGRDYLGHYTYIRYETLAAALVHVLPRTSWAVFTLTLDIGEDGRTGALQLVLPAAIFQTIDEGEIARRAGVDHNQEALWHAHMESALAASPLELDTVLERMMLPLGQVTSLQIGDRIDLQNGALSEVTVEIAAPKGPIVMARGRLGQYGGKKVVKVTEIIGENTPSAVAALPAPETDESSVVEGKD